MKHYFNTLPLDAPYFQIGTDQLPYSPRPIRDWLKPKLSLALREHSYPLLISGGAGSGRYKIILQMLMQNIQDKKPFIFVRGTGDNHYLERLHHQAVKFGSAEELRNITFDLAGPGTRHTFDPINPLVGNPLAFDALFGTVAGPLLHVLCLAEQQAGNLVDLAKFKSFLDLDNLQIQFQSMKYQPAKQALEGYLSELAIYFLNGPTPKQNAKHNQYMHKAWAFFHVLDHSKLCSTTPDVDFRRLFKDGKHVCVTMPSGQNEHDYFGFLPTLFACLISQSSETPRGVSANPEVIFDYVFEQPTSLWPALDRLREMNTVFGIHGTFDSDDPKGGVVSQVCSAAKSVLLMKSEFYCFPDALKLSAFDHGVSGKDIVNRDVLGLSAETCFAWGHLTVIRKGKPYSLRRLAHAALRANDHGLK